MRRSKRGFTLVELMVVIAIIMVLVSIVYSVYSKTKERGATASCMSNLKQLAHATIMYRNDCDGYMPYMALQMGDPRTGAVYYSRWVHALMPFMNNDAVFVCPSNRVSMDEASRPTTQTPGPETSYFYCGFYMHGTSESDVTDVSGTITLMDGWFFENQGGPMGWNFPMFNAPLADGGQMASWINGDVVPPYVNAEILKRLRRHSGAVNVAYYDGHARNITEARPQDFTPARD